MTKSKKKRKVNLWMYSTIILALIILVLGGFMLAGNTSSKKAGKNFVDFINAQGQTTVKFVKAQNYGSGLYEVVVENKGQESPVYLTKDGEYWVQVIAPLTKKTIPQTSTQEQDIPKSETPEVELFIWGYCPYGVQAQKPLAEVAELLKDTADFKAVLYYAGHGEFEKQENKIQECLQQEYPEKYWEYASKFVEEIYPVCGCSSSSTTCDYKTQDSKLECDLTESTKLIKSLGLDSDKIMSCVKDQGESLLSTSLAKAKELDVKGSPTLIINGVKANTERSAEAFKSAICNAYETTPEECAEALTSTKATTTGNC